MDFMDISRIKEFRQFKKEIRGSEQYLIVGIDIGKVKHHAFLGTANGHTVQKGLIVKNNLSGFSYLMGRVQFHMDRDGFEDVVFGLEPTSVYHKPLAEFLIEQGHLVVLQPMRRSIRIAAYWMGAGIKTMRSVLPTWLICSLKANASIMICLILNSETCAICCCFASDCVSNFTVQRCGFVTTW